MLTPSKSAPMRLARLACVSLTFLMVACVSTAQPKVQSTDAFESLVDKLSQSTIDRAGLVLERAQTVVTQALDLIGVRYRFEIGRAHV